MKITNEVSITKHKDGTLTVINEGEILHLSEKETEAWTRVYDLIRNNLDNKSAILQNALLEGDISLTSSLATPRASLSPSEILERGLSELMNFFTEFDFEPNFRFVNTLSWHLQNGGNDSAKEYISNYFNLTDNGSKNEVIYKLDSREFGNILDEIKAGGEPKNKVNNRFKVYYGSAGTGKTTLAMKETENRCIICNASMLPSDLMEDFVFNEGKATFQPSALWNCMTEGKPIVLDEINLLPFDSLRFLQGILDGKKEFDYKGHKVEIADGFEVIGTMNLSIGGMIYGLPEPLIDRSADMKEFHLTASQLAKAILE